MSEKWMGMEGEFTWEDACQEAAKGSEPIGVACQAGSRGKAGRRSSHTHHSQHRIPAPSPAPSTNFYSSEPFAKSDQLCHGNGRRRSPTTRSACARRTLKPTWTEGGEL